MIHPGTRLIKKPAHHLGRLLLSCILLVSGQAVAEPRDLERLSIEKQALVEELEQYHETIKMLHAPDTDPARSSDPVVRSLATKASLLEARLTDITEQENTLRQQQLKQPAPASPPPGKPHIVATVSPPNEEVPFSLEQEAAIVSRLQDLLENYYQEARESAIVQPSAEEVAARKAAQRDASSLEGIPFSADKVRLSGAEGSTALAQITQRLTDPDIPESRRDIAPICLVKTRLFDTLVSSENRSLTPVGKHHYLARVRLQPGHTTLTILSNQWELRLPQHSNARDYLIMLHRPEESRPELHVFAVEDLLAVEGAHIPAWLPDELDIKTRAG